MSRATCHFIPGVGLSSLFAGLLPSRLIYFFIHPLFNGFKHLHIEMSLIVFVTIYILFVIYVGAFELVCWAMKKSN